MAEDLILYPEMLTGDEIKDCLKRRHIECSSIHDKMRLLDLYSRSILPLPQREYRQNQRGRLMTYNQLRLKKKRKLDNEWLPKSNKLESATNERSRQSLPHAHTTSRLKPPPTLGSTNERKSAKLTVNSSDGIANAKRIRLNPISSDKIVYGSDKVQGHSERSHTKTNKSSTVVWKNSHVKEGVDDKGDNSPGERKQTMTVSKVMDQKNREHVSSKKKIPRISWP